MAQENNPKSRETELVIQQLEDEVLIYDLKVNKAYCLNSTSALVWNLCDGNSSVSEISKKLSKQLKQPVPEDLVWLAVDGLKKDSLLSESEERTIKFDGLSRREAIKRVGLATMIALPVTASLVAPTAAAAQSCVARGSSPGCAATQQQCTSFFASRCCSGSVSITSNPVGCSNAESAQCVCN